MGCPNPCEGPPSLWLPTFGFPNFEGPNFQSPPAQKWRPFCLRFEGLVEDFNYGTLLRLDSRREYSEENTIFGEKRGLRGRGRTPTPQIHPGVDLFPFFSATRIQFFAIEIARNREGCNDHVYSRARETQEEEKSG